MTVSNHNGDFQSTEMCQTAGNQCGYSEGMLKSSSNFTTPLAKVMTSKGLTDPALAALADTSKQQIWKLRHGVIRMSPEWARKLAPLLDVGWQVLIGEPESDPPASNVRPAPDATPLPGFASFQNNLPAYGAAQGGEDGAVEWGDGSYLPADMVRRPLGLEGAREAFAMYVCGTSMYPRWDEGDLIYINPRRPTPVGSFVMVVFRLAAENDERRAMVKKLVRRSGGKVVLEQFNPPKHLELEVNLVEHIWHVLEHREIMGG